MSYDKEEGDYSQTRETASLKTVPVKDTHPERLRVRVMPPALPGWKPISSFCACFHLYSREELGEGTYFLNDLFL